MRVTFLVASAISRWAMSHLAGVHVAGVRVAAAFRRKMSLPLAALAVAAFVALTAAQPRAGCRDSSECRQRALEAADRKDYEAFHDLAWRAVQLGPKNDPALLFILARAQSLSGRPHDALVMLRRLASTGVAREALTSGEFDRVRALKDWPDVETLLAAYTGAPGPPAPAPAVPPAAPPAPPAAARDPPPASTDPAPAPEAVVFAAGSFKPAALAYDAVSRRFIIGDTDVSRLAVIDEFSRQIATLASGRSAGFGAVTAIEIDPREGDLWVASVDGSSGTDVPALHRLQLISGRVLKKFSAPAATKMPAGRFADIAVAPDGTVYVIQEEGSIWRLMAGGSSLQLASRVTGSRCTSAAVSNQGAIYLARAENVLRFRPFPSAHVAAADGVELTGLARIRWSRGSLIGVQRAAAGASRVIRVRLSRDGRSATALEVLDPSARMPNSAAATLAGDVFYYVAETDGAELAIRGITIK